MIGHSLGRMENNRKCGCRYALTSASLEEHVDSGAVVLKLDICRCHTLGLKLPKFVSKDMLVEIAVELLVGHVDAELFKAVDFEFLEPKNVEHAHLQEIVEVGSPFRGKEVVGAGLLPLIRITVKY